MYRVSRISVSFCHGLLPLSQNIIANFNLKLLFIPYSGKHKQNFIVIDIFL